MSHKAKIAALVLGTLISSQAFAYDHNFYAIAGGGYGDVKDGKLDSMDATSFITNANLSDKDEWQGVYHGALGFNIDGPWAIESNYWQYADINNSAIDNGTDVHQKSINRSVDLGIVGRACLMQPLTGYIRLGVGYAWLNRDNSLGINLLTTSGDDENQQGVGLSAAVGLEYDFNDWFFMRGEVATITGDAMQSNATLNLGVRFG